MNFNNILNSLEAVFFASGEPIEIDKLCENFKTSKTELVKIINTLKDRYINTSIELIEIGESYQLVTKAEYGPLIKEIIEKNTNTLLSQAALEVLAIIAYNGPITRNFVEQARGVDSSGVIYNLIDRGLLKEAGRLDLPGRPIAYETTEVFLRSFSLSSLADLPSVKKEITENRDQTKEDI